MLIHVGQHEGNVGGEQVIHLIAEGGFAEQLGAPHQVAYGHVEIGIARRPVGDAGEGVRYKDILKKNIDQCYLILFFFLLFLLRFLTKLKLNCVCALLGK